MNDLNFIVCPDCKKQIPISDALSHHLEEKYQAEFEEKFKSLDEERKLIEDQQKSITEQFEIEKKKIAEEQQKVKEEIEKEKEAITQQQQKYKQEFEQKLQQSLEEKENELKEKSRKFLLEQKEKLKEEALVEAKSRLNLEIEDLKKQNEEKETRIREAQEQELKLREEKRNLEEKEKNLEIEMIRRLDEERTKLSEKIRDEQGEKLRLQQMEYEKKIGDMQRALEDAQRRGQASSERFRGEVQELNLEETIRSNFMYDKISEVPKGILGADVIQEVYDNMGRQCGTIVWECKRTKSFNEEWVTKLKDDVIRAKGNVAIIVTQSLPEDITTFAWRNGVWVCSFASYLELAMVLRMNLMELKRMEKLNEGKGEKMSQVYNYLSSDEFRNKVQAIAETFIMMREQLEQEKRAFQRQWSAREMQIKRLTEGTVSIVGDLQGLMGSSMPMIEGMEMPGIE